MNTATPRSMGARAAGMALLLAWLALLGVLGAAAGYVLFLPDQSLEGKPKSIAALDLSNPEMAGEDPVARPDQISQANLEPEPEQKTQPKPPVTPVVEAPEPQTPEAPKPKELEAATETEPEPALEAGPKANEDTTMAAVREPKAPAASEAAPEPAATQEAALPKAPEIEPPWRRHAQPFDAPAKLPRIAIVLTGLGLSSAATEAAIKQLPGAISLSFTPYSRRLNEWIALARVNGHEVLLDLPMEPTSYPDDDPGPQALLTALSANQNLKRLDWALRRASGFVGVTSVMGSRFLASEEHMTPVLKELKSRGMLFLDSRASETSVAGPLALKLGAASAVNDRFLDRAQASRVAIDARLVQLERIARNEGYAVAIGQTYPVTIERLRTWASGVESRGFALAPLSSIAAERLARHAAMNEPVSE